MAAGFTTRATCLLAAGGAAVAKSGSSTEPNKIEAPAPADPEPKLRGTDDAGTGGEVVRLDRFRKK